MGPLRRLIARLRRLFSPTRSLRVRGRPSSPNGASSFHLRWEVAPGMYDAVSAVLEVAHAPAVAELYFWAIQASFHDGASERGGAHLGLQWNPRFPSSRAANWGGYADARLGGDILAGTGSALPSTPNDPNTRDYPWQPGERYRLTISPTPRKRGWWRGSITNLDTGEETVVRDLGGGGDRLAGFVTWTEVFARCDHPSVLARWSELRVRTRDGAWLEVDAATVNYQDHRAGGCDNTNAAVDTSGFLQETNTARTTPQGTRLTT